MLLMRENGKEHARRGRMETSTPGEAGSGRSHGRLSELPGLSLAGLLIFIFGLITSHLLFRNNILEFKNTRIKHRTKEYQISES